MNAEKIFFRRCFEGQVCYSLVVNGIWQVPLVLKFVNVPPGLNGGTYRGDRQRLPKSAHFLTPIGDKNGLKTDQIFANFEAKSGQNPRNA